MKHKPFENMKPHKSIHDGTQIIHDDCMGDVYVSDHWRVTGSPQNTEMRCIKCGKVVDNISMFTIKEYVKLKEMEYRQKDTLLRIKQEKTKHTMRLKG